MKEFKLSFYSNVSHHVVGAVVVLFPDATQLSKVADASQKFS